MASCHEMRLGQIYVCESCGLALKVVKECKEVGTPEQGSAKVRHSVIASAAKQSPGGWGRPLRFARGDIKGSVSPSQATLTGPCTPEEECSCELHGGFECCGEPLKLKTEE
jgi:hypothetical protein